MREDKTARILELAEEFEKSGAEELLDWALGQFHPEIALACSFGAEDMVLVDILSGLRADFSVFTLDTHLLFPETYQLMERVRERYRLSLRIFEPDISLEEMEIRYGKELFYTNPDLCCQLRKIQPLKKALSGLRAWITGIRREQAPTRARAKKIELDSKFGLIKINPLVDWTHEQVWDYIRKRGVPYNPLHDRNYPSIGCAPCTRPVQPGEDLRAGRWPGREKTECGLHQ